MNKSQTLINKELSYFSEIYGKYSYAMDMPNDEGGEGIAPSPKQLLISSLAGCVAMTIRYYLNQKKWDLGEMKIAYELEILKNKNKFYLFIDFENELSDNQKERILRVSHKCPIHKILTSDKNEIIIKI